jgi:hypothetical protein
MYGSAVWTNNAAITITGGSLGGTIIAGVTPELHNTGSIVRATGSYSMSGVAVDNDGLIEAANPDNSFTINAGAGVSTGRFVGLALGGSTPFRVGVGATIDRVSVSGTLVLPDDAAFELRDLRINGGDITGRTTLTLRGHFHAYYGSVGGGGMTLILPADATMEWTHAFGLYAKRFESWGDVLVTETGLGRPLTTWPRRTVWENYGKITLVSGLFPVSEGDQQAGTLTDEAGRLVNHGTIVKTSTSTFTIRPVIVNDGVVDVQRGQLTATRFEQTPDATLRCDLGGTATNQFGRLSATTFLYSGRLESTLSDGFTATAGQSFNIITAPSFNARSGLFHSLGLTGVTLNDPAAGGIISLAGVPAPGAPATSAPDFKLAPSAFGAATVGAAPAGGASSTSASCRRPAAARAAGVAPLCLSGGRYRVSPGRWTTLGAAERGARVRVLARSRGLSARVSGGALHVRLSGGSVFGTVRYRIVRKDGRWSVATVRVVARS